MKLDQIDLKILEAVQKDGRITKIKLADIAGLSPTPCWIRLKKLEKSGLIAGYHARISPRSVAPFATVLVEFTLSSHRQIDFDRFEKHVRKMPEVLSCWSVGGGFDYILKIIAPDIDTYQRLVDQMLSAKIGIDRYFTYIVTRTVKDDFGFPTALLARD